MNLPTKKKIHKKSPEIIIKKHQQTLIQRQSQIKIIKFSLSSLVVCWLGLFPPIQHDREVLVRRFLSFFRFVSGSG